MAFVRTEDIRGHRLDSDIFCLGCAAHDDLEELKETGIITDDEVE